MKKRILLGICAVLVPLLAFFGPELLDLYRLDRYVEAAAEAYEANGGPWPQLADVCIGCHGVNGNSNHQGYPSLAGQPAAYVTAQLHNFAKGQRSNPNMGPLAMTLSDTEIDRLANHFSKQSISENQFFQPDPFLQKKGKELVTTGNCAACHGERLMGHDQFPRLAGQGYDYLVAQLDSFASGARTEATGMMKGIAANASPDERRAIANYLASLAPENKTNQTSSKDLSE